MPEKEQREIKSTRIACCHDNHTVITKTLHAMQLFSLNFCTQIKAMCHFNVSNYASFVTLVII